MLPFFLVPLALALGAATQRAQSPADRAVADSAATANANKPVTIQFENQGWELATVYAVPQSGMAFRLGQVSPGRTERLVVPRSVVAGGLSSINIVAVPFARRAALSSGPVTVSPGDVLRATVPSTGNAVWILPGH